MPRLLRLLCLTLAVAFLASMSLHGSSDARDKVEHMADEIAAVHGVEVSGHTHPDCGEDGGETTPGHHHHTGDGHAFAVIDRSGVTLSDFKAGTAAGWPMEHLPEGRGSDGPDQPPKRMRTVV